jgi:hypothetical protein
MLPAMWPTAMWETASLAINDVLLQQSSGMPEYRIMNSKRGILQGERDIPRLGSDRDRDVSNSWPFLTKSGVVALTSEPHPCAVHHVDVPALGARIIHHRKKVKQGHSLILNPHLFVLELSFSFTLLQ